MNKQINGAPASDVRREPRPKSNVTIKSDRRGVKSVRATGAAANALFHSLTAKSEPTPVVSTHTPGPWAVMTHRHSDETGERYAITGIIASPNISVATVDELDECVANATLIAAAPELLADHVCSLSVFEELADTLKAMRLLPTDRARVLVEDSIKHTKAVIAKATGR